MRYSVLFLSSHVVSLGTLRCYLPHLEMHISTGKALRLPAEQDSVNLSNMAFLKHIWTQTLCWRFSPSQGKKSYYLPSTHSHTNWKSRLKPSPWSQDGVKVRALWSETPRFDAGLP